jgi:hypothetical protein
MAIDDEQLVPNVEGARMLGITTRAKSEREKHDPDFPRTYRFRGRKYNKKGDLRAYIRRAASKTENAGWQITRTRQRDEGKFTAVMTEPVMRQTIPGQDVAKTKTTTQSEFLKD